MSDSVVLTPAGCWFHHRMEKSCDFPDRPLLALCGGGTRRPVEIVELSTRAGVCGLTKAWRSGAVPLTAL